MQENKPEGEELILQAKSRISKVWILPLVSLLIGVAMVYNHYQNLGTTIEVQFNTAEGLIAGKTVLKNRNVDIGIVKKISFSDNKESIIVGLEVQKGMESFLAEDSLFWVVRPRIGAKGISGIETLLSGAYIEVSAGESSQAAERFVGLESPPITPSNADGIHLKLVSRGNNALNIGMPILYRGFEVGAVESKTYDDLEQEALYDIFVNAPFHNLVTENTSFWNTSGVAFKADSQGVSLEFASLETLLTGGIEFDLLEGRPAGLGVPQYHTFRVYDSKESIAKDRVYQFLEYVVLVEDSVEGLYKGAPVDYRGIRIGTVAEPFMAFDKTRAITGSIDETRIPVVLKIEPERLSQNEEVTLEVFALMMDKWIRDGVIASLETENLLTGSLKVSLSPGAERKSRVSQFGPYPIIPFKAGAIGTLTKSMESVLNKINNLELERTIDNVNDLIDRGENTLRTADAALVSAQHAIDKAGNTAQSLELTLAELRLTLVGLQPNSDLYRSVNASIQQLEVTLAEMKPLINDISNKPNKLLFSPALPPDIEPKAFVNGSTEATSSTAQNKGDKND